MKPLRSATSRLGPSLSSHGKRLSALRSGRPERKRADGDANERRGRSPRDEVLREEGGGAAGVDGNGGGRLACGSSRPGLNSRRRAATSRDPRDVRSFRRDPRRPSFSEGLGEPGVSPWTDGASGCEGPTPPSSFAATRGAGSGQGQSRSSRGPTQPDPDPLGPATLPRSIGKGVPRQRWRGRGGAVDAAVEGNKWGGRTAAGPRRGTRRVRVDGRRRPLGTATRRTVISPSATSRSACVCRRRRRRRGGGERRRRG